MSHARRINKTPVKPPVDPNAPHIWALFCDDNGAHKLPYKTVATMIETLLVEVATDAEASTLPDEPDRDLIDAIVVAEYGRSVEIPRWQ